MASDNMQVSEVICRSCRMRFPSRFLSKLLLERFVSRSLADRDLALNRARARGFTGVRRHGGPLLFRFLTKQTFHNERENFLRVPPEKRPLALEA